MNAKMQMLGYAKLHNNNTTLTDEEFVGQMVTDGIVINRTPLTKTIARAHRDGKVITVTETKVVQVSDVINGKLEYHTTETTQEIFRVEI